MKNFVLANAITLASYEQSDPFDISKMNVGQVAAARGNVYFNRLGKVNPIVITESTDGNVPNIFYIDQKNIKVERTDYAAASKFRAKFNSLSLSGTAVQSAENAEFIVNIFKKGAVFNERNVWTTTGKDLDTLIKNVNNASGTHGIVATPVKSGDDTVGVDFNALDYDNYSIVVRGAGFVNDKYKEVDITDSDHANTKAAGSKGFGTVPQLQDLIMSCVGEMGHESTYVDAAPTGSDKSLLFTSKFPINASAKYLIYTIRYINPRYDHNKDEQLNCLLHLAILDDRLTSLGATNESSVNGAAIALLDKFVAGEDPDAVEETSGDGD